MKSLLYLLFLAFVLNSGWGSNLNEAQEIAKKENKLILLNFSGSDWCGPCMKLRRDIFESDVFREFATANLILVNADFPRLKKNQPTKEQQAKNNALAEIYNPKGIFPYTLLLNSDGKVLKSWEGYPNISPEEFIEQIRK